LNRRAKTIIEVREDGLIVRAKKEEDLSGCNSWRGITLLSLTSKLFSKITVELFADSLLEKDIPKEKADFRKGSSCSDEISAIRQILEQAKEWNSTV